MRCSVRWTSPSVGCSSCTGWGWWTGSGRCALAAARIRGITSLTRSVRSSWPLAGAGRRLGQGQTIERKRRVAASRTLDHLLGINQFFTDLAGWARVHPSARLQRWWSEQRCAEPGVFGATLISPVRPDGHGVFAEGGRRVAFFTEFDTGFEQHSVLLAKVSGYAGHVAKGGPAWPVLFWLPSTAREQRLHHLLAGSTSPFRWRRQPGTVSTPVRAGRTRCGWWLVTAMLRGASWTWPISVTTHRRSQAALRRPDQGCDSWWYRCYSAGIPRRRLGDTARGSGQRSHYWLRSASTASVTELTVTRWPDGVVGPGVQNAFNPDRGRPTRVSGPVPTLSRHLHPIPGHAHVPALFGGLSTSWHDDL